MTTERSGGLTVRSSASAPSPVAAAFAAMHVRARCANPIDVVDGHGGMQRQRDGAIGDPFGVRAGRRDGSRSGGPACRGAAPRTRCPSRCRAAASASRNAARVIAHADRAAAARENMFHDWPSSPRRPRRQHARGFGDEALEVAVDEPAPRAQETPAAARAARAPIRALTSGRLNLPPGNATSRVPSGCRSMPWKRSTSTRRASSASLQTIAPPSIDVMFLFG